MENSEKNISSDCEKKLDYWKMVNLDASMYEGSTSMGGWRECDAGSDCGSDCEG